MGESINNPFTPKIKMICSGLILVLILGGMIILSMTPPTVQAQTNPTSVPTLDPTIVALGNMMATQTIELSKADLRMERIENSVGKVETEWGLLGLVAGAVITILSYLGITSFMSANHAIKKSEKEFTKKVEEVAQVWEKHIVELENAWEKRSAQNQNKLLEKFDLTNLPVFVPQGVGDLRRRLELSALQHIEYKNLEKLGTPAGVIVVKLANQDEENNFIEYIKKNAPNPGFCAFVLYANYKLKDETTNCYDNLAVGNFPATVVSNILAIGRGLEIKE